MAFNDITQVLYDGKIKLDYKDASHRYYIRRRIDWDKDVSDPKAWGKATRPKGTTTLLGDTLEKKGLMTWPLGLAIRELFGFYDFKNEAGERLIGFSKEKIISEDGEIKETGNLVGTMWPVLKDLDAANVSIATDLKDLMLPVVKSANSAWQRKQKKGADIGSVVHAAIEAFIKGQDYDIHEQYNWLLKESEFDTEAERELAFKESLLEVEQAKQAFLQFQKWWLTVQPELYGTEEILYSLEHDIAGTYDGDIGVPKTHHPRGHLFEKDIIRCTADWKTSNASNNKDAAAPEGVYYSYFIQSAIYEMMRREMGFEPADDLLIVSARKDGSFSLVYASELDLTIDECIEWAKCVITCYRLMDKTKQGLLAHAETGAINHNKEAF